MPTEINRQEAAKLVRKIRRGEGTSEDAARLHILQLEAARNEPTRPAADPQP